MTDPVMLLSQVHGDGRVTYRALTEAGFQNLSSIAQCEVATLAERAQLSPGTAGRLRDGARDMLWRGNEIRVETAAQESRAAGGVEAIRPTEIHTPRIAGRTTAPGVPFSAGIAREEASMLHGFDRPRAAAAPSPAFDAPPAESEGGHTEPPAPEPRPLRDDPEYAQFLPERPRESIAAAARAAESLRAAPPAADDAAPPRTTAQTVPPAPRAVEPPRPHRPDKAPEAREAGKPSADRRTFWSFG